jgi:hypothetical protein
MDHRTNKSRKDCSTPKKLTSARLPCVDLPDQPWSEGSDRTPTPSSKLVGMSTLDEAKMTCTISVPQKVGFTIYQPNVVDIP